MSLRFTVLMDVDSHLHFCLSEWSMQRTRHMYLYNRLDRCSMSNRFDSVHDNVRFTVLMDVDSHLHFCLPEWSMQRTRHMYLYNRMDRCSMSNRFDSVHDEFEIHCSDGC